MRKYSLGREERSIMRWIIAGGALSIIGTLAFYGLLIYFAFWSYNHFFGG